MKISTLTTMAKYFQQQTQAAAAMTVPTTFASTPATSTPATIEGNP